MNKSNVFQIVSDHSPKGDQVKAIEQLTLRVKNNEKSSVLLGATGTGKTFTIANVIANTQKRALVLAHNKTLAGQLYNELKALFPNNRVEYYISYFDYFQPEAYLPKTDTFIEKSSVTNQTIEMMRLSTLTSLVTRQDVIVVASVACIYPSSPPQDFEDFKYLLKVGNEENTRKNVINKLVQLGYDRNDMDLVPGNFRVKGDVVEFIPGYSDKYSVRLSFWGEELESIAKVDFFNNKVIDYHQEILVTQASEYLLKNARADQAIERIEKELEQRLQQLNKENKPIEYHRLQTRTRHDIDSIKELGFCPGIENYAAHLELRDSGQTPWSLLDYMKDDWILIVDESHMTIPQVKGMYNTDRSRKETLIEHGFRLPSALDNRPLNFEEFLNKIKQVIYVSATPNEWEKQEANNQIVEQIVRPTGLIDPEIEVRPSVGQIDNLVSELQKQILKKDRTLITVLTIRMAEDLTEYLKQKNIKVAYLHNELKTLERDKVLNDLRRGVYDVVVGINLLREGLDLPEVSLVCIFDANKPGFFRSDKALIQIIGRAARNDHGKIIMYADTISDAMKVAIEETNRRRAIQIAYNKEHNIVPKTIIKKISQDLLVRNSSILLNALKGENKKMKYEQVIKKLEEQMNEAANNQEYELAAYIRDQILEIKTNGLPKHNTKRKPK